MKTKIPKDFAAKIPSRHLHLLLITAFTFVITLFLSSLPAHAAKTTLSNKSTAISIQGTQDLSYYLNDANSNAKYTYTSSNKKIATVTKDGIVKGIKAGKAKVKIKQTLKKKTTTVGTVTVNVMKATISPYADTDAEMIHELVNQPGYFRSTYKDPANCTVIRPENYLDYTNIKAVYKIYSQDTKKLSLTSYGVVKNTSGTGTVKLTIKETYKKKTRTVGTIKIKISNPSLYKETKDSKIIVGNSALFRIFCGKFGIVLTETAEPLSDVNEINAAVHDGYEPFDDDAVLKYEGFADFHNGITFQGKSPGNRYIHFYMYDFAKKQYTTLIDSAFLSVTDIPNAESVYMDFQKDTDYDPDYYNTEDGLQVSCYSSRSYSITTEPYNYTGDFEVTSSDESVVTAFAQRSSYGDASGKLYLTYLNPGTSTITVKANGAETSFKVTVAPRTIWSDDEYDLGAYFLAEEEVSEDDITVTCSDESIATAKLYDVSNNSYKDSNIVSLDIELITAEDFPVDAEEAPITVTAQYKGKEIYSATFNVKNYDY